MALSAHNASTTVNIGAACKFSSLDHLTVELRNGDVFNPGGLDASTLWRGMTDALSDWDFTDTIKALAFTDFALADVDDLVVEVDEFIKGTEELYGMTEPAEVWPRALANLFRFDDDIVDETVRKSAKLMAKMIATAFAPGKLFYAIRQYLLGHAGIQYDATTHTVVATTGSHLPTTIAPKKMALIMTDYLLARDGHYETVADGSEVQVVPEGGISDYLANTAKELNPKVRVTVPGSTPVDIDLTPDEIKDANKEMAGASEGSEDKESIARKKNTYYDDMEDGQYTETNVDAKVEGKEVQGTISSLTIVGTPIKPLFDTIGSTNSPQNAVSLSIAVAALRALRRSTSDKKNKDYETVPALEDAVKAVYGPSLAISTYAQTVTTSNVKTLFPKESVRRNKTAIGEIWSVDTSKKLAVVPDAACLVKLVRSYLNSVAEQIPEGYIAEIPGGLGEGDERVLAVKNVPFIPDLVSRVTAEWCADYKGAFTNKAGYKDVALGLSGVALLSASQLNEIVLTDLCLCSFKGTLNYFKFDDFVECVRKDAESEWARAKQLNTPSNLVADKSGCNPWLVAALAGVGIAAASAKDEKSKGNGVTVVVQNSGSNSDVAKGEVKKQQGGGANDTKSL